MFSGGKHATGIHTGPTSLVFKLRRANVGFRLFGGSDWSNRKCRPLALQHPYIIIWPCSSAALAPVASAVHKLFEEDAPSVIPASYRTATEAIDITLTGVGCVIASYSYDIEHASAFQWATDSTVVFVIQDFEVIDKIASSPLNLVIG